jgi:hypothetical protein
MKKVLRTKSAAGRTRKKKLTLEVIFEKLDEITQRLDMIENDLRELKGIAYPKSEQEKESTPEFFMQK